MNRTHIAQIMDKLLRVTDCDQALKDFALDTAILEVEEELLPGADPDTPSLDDYAAARAAYVLHESLMSQFDLAYSFVGRQVRQTSAENALAHLERLVRVGAWNCRSLLKDRDFAFEKV